tara:strand:- start:1099 stop:2067 length:969 start_codon:yes stop_codon:yes gene_type:complete
MNNKIIIVAGDPNSINSEIIYKAWKKIDSKIKKKLYLIANYNLICKQYRKLKYKTNVIKINNIEDNIISSNLKIIDIPINFKNPFKVSFKASSKYVLKSLNLAHTLAKNKKVKGIINCPINKNLIKVSKKIGVTEFFASKCKIKNSSEVMLIHNKKFSVVPLTTHLNIKNIPKNITSKLIIKKLMSLNKGFKKIFKIKPRIGVLGLNPHNAELNEKSEEVKEIIPAISKLKKAGLNVYGPLVADTTFVNNYKKYDVIVGMYHDQVLAPFKTLFHFDAINITLGLNYLRVSPDHGPAIDLIGKNKANYLSLFQCVKFINNINR